MARVVLLGTPDYAIPALRALIKHHTVVAVVTQPDRYTGRGRRRLVMPPVKVVAVEHGIPVYQPERLSRDSETLADLESVRADLFVLAAYGQILRQNVLDMPPHGVIGLHASLLPRFRGAAPVAAAIRTGETETGVTLMLTEAGLDTGPILAQSAIPIRKEDTTETLTTRLAELAAEILLFTLPEWLDGDVTPVPQDDTLATYAPQIAKAEGLIDWSTSADAIDRHIRAMTPWPGAFTFLQGERLRILQARPLPIDGTGLGAGCVTVLDEGLAVGTGEGLLLLELIQPSGRKPMLPDAFICGRPECIGDVLG